MTLTNQPSREDLERLKISALSQGVSISDAALVKLGGRENLTVHEYATTGGIPIRVGGLDINAPFDEWYCAEAEIKLDTSDGDLVLRFLNDTYRIERVYPLPSYLDQVDAAGNQVKDVVYTHLDRIRLSPISGCAYDCAFCDMPGRVRLHPARQLIAAARIAQADPRFSIRHLLISGGSPGSRDERAFGDTLVELVESLAPSIEVDVMMSASQHSVPLIDRLVDAGVHGFSINLEVETRQAANLHISGKHRRARPHFDEAVSFAVSLLGRGTGRVRSLILPGLETVDETLSGVGHIAALGADPVLSPFRPAQGTRLSAADPVDAATLRQILDESRRIVSEHGVRLGPRCLPCQHNTLTFPWDVDGQ